MTTLTAVNARITGDSTGLQTALDRAGGKLKAFGKQTRQVINSVAKWGAAVAAAGAAVGIALVKKSLDAIDAQAKLARQLRSTSKGLANVQRAGELAGVSSGNMTMALRRLDVALGEAAQGTGRAADAMEQLGLSAAEVAAMDADERLASINEALRDNVPAAERAAVAAALFGSRYGSLVQEIDKGAIATAAREVDALGTAVNEVDSATIERANDAMSSIGEVVKGVAYRITEDLAPVIEAIATGFRDAAIESRGFEKQVGSSIEGTVRGLASLLNVVAGAGRAFEVVGKTGAVGMLTLKSAALGLADAIVFGPAKVVKELIEAFNSIPLLPDIPVPELKLSKKVQDEIKLTNAAIKEGVADIAEALERPLPGNVLVEAFEKAKAASAELSARMAGLRDNLQLIELPDVAMKEGGQTEEEEAEAHQEQIEARLERIRQGLLTEAEIEREAFENKLEVTRHALELGLMTEEEHRQRVQALEEQHSNKMSSIREKGMKDLDGITGKSLANQLGGFRGFQSQMLDAAAQGNLQQFLMQKKGAISQAFVDMKESITGAYKVGSRIGGPPLGAAYAAAAGAAQLAQLNSIRSASFGGGGGGGGGAPSSAAPTPVTPAQQPSQEQGGSPSGRTVSVSGLNPDEIFSGRQLIELINTATEDGARIILVD